MAAVRLCLDSRARLRDSSSTDHTKNQVQDWMICTQPPREIP